MIAANWYCLYSDHLWVATTTLVLTQINHALLSAGMKFSEVILNAYALWVNFNTLHGPVTENHHFNRFCCTEPLKISL